MFKLKSVTLWIFIAMFLGILVGWLVNTNYNPETADLIAKKFKLLLTIFLNLIKMIVAPLVFSTLVVGIAHLGDLKTVGRIGGRALIWFISASIVSLLLGMLLVNTFKPGVGINFVATASKDVDELSKKSGEFSLDKFIEHLFTDSMVKSMANNEMLQIVVFSVLFGVACAAIGDKGKPVIKALDGLAHVILKMVGYIMWVAPLGVFGAMAFAISKYGLNIIGTYSKYVSEFYLGLALLWLILLLAGTIFLKWWRVKRLLPRLKEPLSIAFSTASSEAVFPKLTEEMERFGCNNKIVSFVLPLGYSFNLDGSMMYMTFASIFIAQACNIPLDFGTQLTMLFVLLITSKGIAAVPRASLLVVLATCQQFGIPPEGLALILPIDHFCDMGRSMTNVLGNALATGVVSKWEGELKDG
jgi:Na+/H+-dicarboxylate symporter